MLTLITTCSPPGISIANVSAIDPPSEPQTEILTQIENLDGRIQEIVDVYDVFGDDTAEKANILSQKINEVHGMVESGHYNAAVNKLKNEKEL